MTTTTSHKLSSLTRKASVLTLVLLVVVVGGILFAAPSSAMAQQQTTTTTATTQPTTTPPLTPEEQQQQDRIQNTIAATTRNLEQGQKEVDGVVYTPRWSNPVWVEADSLSILFVYCLPGEFADSGQDILGGSELEVLESYSLAVTSDLTGWLMVVENENQTNRLPAAVGVICASDLNDAEARILSPQEQTEINNIFQQFINIWNIQITNITQVINIINNVTTNGTGTTTPTNGTGGNGTGCQLEITTNEETYTSGQKVTITITNDGDEALETANSLFGLEIKNVDTGEVYPIISLQVITTLEAGGSRTFEFTYEELVSEIGTGTIEARFGGDGCSASTTFTLTNEIITEPLRAQLNLDSTDIPATHRFEADAHGGTPPYTYHWDFGDGQEANVQNTRHTYENPGTYTATLTVTDATGQTASDSTEVIVQPEAPTTGEPTANATGGQ
jgi:PKD repeat protein